MHRMMTLEWKQTSLMTSLTESDRRRALASFLCSYSYSPVRNTTAGSQFVYPTIWMQQHCHQTASAHCVDSK